MISTPAVTRINDRGVSGNHAGVESVIFDEASTIMNTPVAQRLWKWGPVVGLLTIVVGVMVLTWPGPSILVTATLFGVCLLMRGLVELVLAFTLPRSAAPVAAR